MYHTLAGPGGMMAALAKKVVAKTKAPKTVTVQLPGGGSSTMLTSVAASLANDIRSAQVTPVAPPSVLQQIEQAIKAPIMTGSSPKMPPQTISQAFAPGEQIMMPPPVLSSGVSIPVGTSGAAVEIAVAKDQAQKRARREASRTDRASVKTNRRTLRAAAAAATPSSTTESVAPGTVPSLSMPSTFASAPASFAPGEMSPSAAPGNTVEAVPDRSNLLWIALGLGGILIYLRKSRK